MITRQQLIDDLELLALRMATELPYVDPEVESGDKEIADPNHPALVMKRAAWSYVKGIAAGRILQLRDQLKEHP